MSGPARERVLVYVANALNIAAPVLNVGLPPSPPQDILRTPLVEAALVTAQPPAVDTRHTDVRSLRESKEPRTAVEMAAIVAYYLNDIAPEGEHSQTVGTADLDKYFKQAGYRLPKAQNMTLINATAAGYFDRVGQGQYKLNPVGYNLVVHNLPAHSSESGGGGRASKRARPVKKTVPTKKPAVRRAVPTKKSVVKKAVPTKKTAAKKLAAPLATQSAASKPTVR